MLESSIRVDSSLGQGPGSVVGTAGQSSTCEFVTTLGPLYAAVGAGTTVSSPQLVRMGEVKVYDLQNGSTQVFGGYAALFDDISGPTTSLVRTKVQCYDYWQHLDRIVVNQVYAAQTDIQILHHLLATYAPAINRSAIPTVASFLFPVKNFRNFTLQKAIQAIADATGFCVWITPGKLFQYVAPAALPPAPFSLSTSPNNTSSYPYIIRSEQFDDTSAVNRVFFFGGRVPSNDFTQDLSPFANGSNTTFPLAYYPHKASFGKIKVTVNGVQQVVGSAEGASTAKNTFKSKGGLCDVLINYSGHALVFDRAPAAGATVLCTYRYEAPLVVTVTDFPAYQFWGQWLDAAIADQTVFDKNQAILRSRTLLTEQARGLRTLKVTCYQPGLQAGMAVKLTNPTRGINDTFIVQSVTAVIHAGAGSFKYEVDLGAWRWNHVDIIRSLAHVTLLVDQNTDENTQPTLVAPTTHTTGAHDTTAVTKTQQYGVFYARASALGDGHDAYSGFFSISS